jgi:hypothetical protein
MNDGPYYWKHEPGLLLPPAVETYLLGHLMTGPQTAPLSISLHDPPSPVKGTEADGVCGVKTWGVGLAAPVCLLSVPSPRGRAECEEKARMPVLPERGGKAPFG